MSGSESRQTKRTKRFLSDALVELMNETSYDAITVQEIVDRADVGRATFYNHYKDKEQLLIATLASIREEMARQLAATPDTPGSLPGMRALLVGASERSQLFELIFTNSKAFAQINTAITDSVRATMAAQLGDQIDLGVAPAFVAGAILGAARWWTTEQTPPPISVMERHIEVLVRQGVEGFVPTMTNRG